MRIRRIGFRIRAVDEYRPTIVPSDLSALEVVEAIGNPEPSPEPPTEQLDADAYRVQCLAPGTWAASYLHHRAIGASAEQAQQRLESLIRGDAARSEAWGRRIWTGHALSADPVILEDRRQELASALDALRPLSPTDWPAICDAWRIASTMPLGRYRIPDMLTHPDHLAEMRSACHRGAAGPLLKAAEVALVRSVWLPAAVAWGCVACAAATGLAVVLRGVGGLL